MAEAEKQQIDRRRSRRIVRVAGALLVVLGVANVALGGISTFTTDIRLSDATGVALAVLGTITIVLGVLVAAGRRWALMTSLVVFGGLFVVQAFAATGTGAPAPAVVTLLAVVLPLVLALRATRSVD